jgi:hypothetical protein
MIISSQRYINEETLEIKRESYDYTVMVSPEFDFDGSKMRIIIDGHHSFAAAKADGVEPYYKEATLQDDDRIELLKVSVDDYLMANHMDDDWYDVETGKSLF